VLIFIIILALCAAGALIALVRGLLAFASDGDLIKSGGDAYLKRGQRQNRMMMQRVMFQGLAVLAVAVLGFMFSAN